MQAFQFGSFDFLSELFLGDNSEPKSSIWLAPVQYMNLSIGGGLSGNIVVLILQTNQTNQIFHLCPIALSLSFSLISFIVIL